MIKKRILLIEEDKRTRDSISDTLEQAGYTIVKAKNGEDGIISALKESPSLVICDSNLSGIKGYDVLKSIRQLKKTQLIPFILLGEAHKEDELRKVMNMGADDYLTRPYKDSDLVKTVKNRVDRYYKTINNIDHFLEKLINTSSEPSFIINEEKTIEYFNNHFFALLGGGNLKLKGQHASKFLDPVSFNKIEKIIDEPDLENLDEFRLDLALNVKNVIENINIRCIFFEHTNNRYLWCMFRNENNQKRFLNRSNEELIISSLTRREIEVIRLISQGLSNNEIAEQLFISNRTVAGHRNNLLQKTGSKNSVSLAVFAIRNSLV